MPPYPTAPSALSFPASGLSSRASVRVSSFHLAINLANLALHLVAFFPGAPVIPCSFPLCLSDLPAVLFPF
eukprot:m.27374 g.27374  ORF g.27374 m.27374 type:complete len:71 (-) comp39735_c0_seq1:52-264(-)